MKNISWMHPIVVLCAVVAAVVGTAGCGSDSFSPFQPEIGNAADNFQFQATAVRNLTTVATYQWSNSGTRAKVNQSSAVTDGSAEVVLFDGNGTEVYRRLLNVNGDSTSAVGAAGTWRVTVTVSNLSGTLNFRAEKL